MTGQMDSDGYYEALKELNADAIFEEKGTAVKTGSC